MRWRSKTFWLNPSTREPQFRLLYNARSLQNNYETFERQSIYQYKVLKNIKIVTFYPSEK